METKNINCFPGYKLVFSDEDKKYHNIYRGEDVGLGGYVFARPGMYGRAICFDVSGMHPASLRALNCFGEYTKNYGDLVDARTAIKHKDFESGRKMLDGKLVLYLDDEKKEKELSKALKLAQNSVYGLTSASFDNPCRDRRNVNNIVALRGALFMVNLKHEIQDRGFTVIHCKTDSVKVLNPDENITNFIFEYGEKYGYNFEIEHIFERICLVNDAVYIAKLAEDDPEDPGKWTATGKQFQVPYVFKTLFSKEPIVFEDLCETKELSKGSAIYLDKNEDLPDVSVYEKEFDKAEEKYKKGLMSDMTFESTCSELNKKIEEGHCYQFIGKVSNFCPIKPGCGGAVLLAKRGNKYDAVTGTKGYRWLEANMVKELGKEDDIDMSYFINLADKAVEAISNYGDFEIFTSDNPFIMDGVSKPLDPLYIPPNLEDDEIPFEDL